MAKKKGGKGKGKGKKEAKGKLSHREREIFLLTIGDLQHKIEWREHLCRVLEEDLEQYAEAIRLERRDRVDGACILEQAIREQSHASERAERAIPDAEQSKVQAEERRARELASKLVQANEEKVSYEAQLQVLGKKLKSLESHGPEKVDDKIREVEAQLLTEDEDAFLKGREQDRRRVEAFRVEMRQTLEQKADTFQDEISGRLDKHFERITEETRWWADMAGGLDVATDRLASLNDAKFQDLRTLRSNLRQRKEASVQASLRLQERKALASELARQNEASAISSAAVAKFRRQQSQWEEAAEGVRRDVCAQKEDLVACFLEIERNEADIEELEAKLEAEKWFGRRLSEFVRRAAAVLATEVRYPLIVTHDGPPRPQKTLSELRSLLEEATRFIFEKKGNNSVL